ncbi:hypothetical protein [Legionella sp. CNM-4043-24]|uniref:hypothetical protein n=1 Tax=Legionella sp. CNM-4043-24 TaxID=3421646 RepID=UPI00403AD4D7
MMTADPIDVIELDPDYSEGSDEAGVSDLDVESADVIEEIDAENLQSVQGVSWRTWFFYAVAVLAAFSAAIYAFLEPSQSRIEDVDGQWWEEMPTETKIASVAMAVNTQIVNTVFFSFFIENAFLRFKDSMGQYFHSCRHFTVNTGNILLSSCAGLANGAIAYSSYLWLPWARISAVFPSSLNVGVTFASRYAGLTNLSSRVAALIDSDVRLQKQCVVHLKHIATDFKGQTNELLENRPCDEETLRELLQSLSSQPGSVDAVSTGEKLKDLSGLAFDIILALLVLIPAFMLFAQKGYDGVELLSDDALSDSCEAEKILIGFLPGLVSSIFMAINTFELRQLTVDLFDHLRRHPRHIPIVAVAVVMNAVSAGFGWRNVAVSAVSPANIFSLTSMDSPWAEAYAGLNSVGSFATSFKAMGQKIVDSKPPPTKLDALIDWTQKNRLSHTTADELRRYSLFRSADTLSRSSSEREPLDAPELIQP